jgi:tetraacyldisaccharide 4'-kinase
VNPAPPPQGSAQRQARWQHSAQHRGWRACSLWPLSVLYSLLMRLRRWLYVTGVLPTQHLPVPVIVVGNVVVGGAGKTPAVIALVHHLRSRGWHPGVVSRGYGRTHLGTLAVQDDTPAEAAGDEPVLIRRATGVPVFVAAKRFDAAQALLATHPAVDVLLCDDGLQHLALGRDVAVVVFDERGIGNGWVLPAGLLREPWPGAAAAQPDQLLVLRQHPEGVSPTEVPLAPGLRAFNAARRLADHAVGPGGERMALSDLQAQPVTAVAGIARPGAFFDMLRARGLNIGREVPLPDHADASAYAALVHEAGPLVCTEKDAVKLFATLGGSTRANAPAVWAVWAVPLELAPDAAFFDAVLAHLPPRSPTDAS